MNEQLRRDEIKARLKARPRRAFLKKISARKAARLIFITEIFSPVMAKNVWLASKLKGDFMLILRFVSLLVIFSIVCGSISAQLPANIPSEREKISPELEKNALDLLEQAASEAGALRLPENRALIYAMAGDLFWTRDEKRART